MSLHRYIVPPPLAVAFHPAPPKPTKKHDKKDDAKDAKKDDKKDDKVDDKKDDQKDDKEKKREKGIEKKDNEADDKADDKADHKTGEGDKKEKKEDMDNKVDPIAVKGNVVVKPASPAARDRNGPRPVTPAKAAPTPAPRTPVSAGSMVPEPPTPVGGVPPTPPAELKAGDSVPPVPAPNSATPKGEAKAKEDNKDGEGEKVAEPEPLRLLGPPPHGPLRTRIDLNQSRQYPPIKSDPRGAYHKYAKAIQGEQIYIDVTKDGWLAEQWRDKPEREALANLRGETEKQRERQIEADRKRGELKKVPQTSGGILVDLWNELAEASNQEVRITVISSSID